MSEHDREADVQATCIERDCQKPFVIEGGEVAFFKRKGFALPKRCKDCRVKKQNRQNSPFKGIADEMKNNDRGGGKHRRHGRERRDDWEGEDGNER